MRSEESRMKERARVAAWHAANPDRVRAIRKAFHERNPGYATEAVKKCLAKKDPETVAADTRARTKRYRDRNPGLAGAQSAKWKAARLQRTPAWADLAAIREAYAEAKRSGLTVDHVIPLQGKLVSGLHVHTNLALVTKSKNSSKRNSFTP
jgi:hypothetical protein